MILKCHAIGCGRTLKPRRLFCDVDWALTPDHIKARLVDRYKRGQFKTQKHTREFLHAVKDAMFAIRAAKSAPAI